MGPSQRGHSIVCAVGGGGWFGGCAFGGGAVFGVGGAGFFGVGGASFFVAPAAATGIFAHGNMLHGRGVLSSVTIPSDSTDSTDSFFFFSAKFAMIEERSASTDSTDSDSMVEERSACTDSGSSGVTF